MDFLSFTAICRKTLVTAVTHIRFPKQRESPLKKTLVPYVHDGSSVQGRYRPYTESRTPPMNAIKASQQVPSTVNGSTGSVQEVRCAVRFPLSLPVDVASRDQHVKAVSRNVSASGVLLELDHQLPPGLEIRFSLRMPGEVLGTAHDVLVHCLGRVVRCSLSQTHYLAAATIDEYKFAEQ
jgi:hypothetical protein